MRMQGFAQQQVLKNWQAQVRPTLRPRSELSHLPAALVQSVSSLHLHMMCGAYTQFGAECSKFAPADNRVAFHLSYKASPSLSAVKDEVPPSQAKHPCLPTDVLSGVPLQLPDLVLPTSQCGQLSMLKCCPGEIGGLARASAGLQTRF